MERRKKVHAVRPKEKSITHTIRSIEKLKNDNLR